MIHRLQWVDAEIRADRYPNTKTLAERFEISRRQALRDFEYLRDSLGAPLEYSAKYHGYYYTSDTYILPGPFVTEEERRLLNHLQAYYSQAAQDDTPGSSTYVKVANLMQKLGGITRQAPGKDSAPERSTWELPSPYRAIIQFLEAPSTRSLSVLEPHIVSREANEMVCELRDGEQFVDLLLGLRQPVQVVRPTWLRERLIDRLNAWLVAQHEPPWPTAQRATDAQSPAALLPRVVADLGGITTAAVAASVPGSVRITAEGAAARRLVQATMARSNNSYLGALYGVLRAAGMCDLSFDLFAAQTGRAFQLSIHRACHASSVSVYNWTADHRRAVDLLGVFTQVITFEPHYLTYPAACKRAVSSIRQGIDRGVGAVTWGVDDDEFGIIRGYDDNDGVFLVDGVGKWSQRETAPILYDNIGRTSSVPILHCQIPIERVDYDQATSQRVVLNHYVEAMENPTLFDADYYYGLSSYQAWEAALRSRSFNQHGIRYITDYYAEARRQMAVYLRTIAPTFPLGEGIVALYEQLAATYEKMVYDVLEQDVSIWNTEGWRPLTPAQADGLASLVREAGRLESQAVAALRRIVRQDEGKSRYGM